MNHSRALRTAVVRVTGSGPVRRVVLGREWLVRGSMRPGVVRRGRPVALGGEERGQGGQRLLGSLLGGVVAAAGDDQGLHVVRGELHRVRDLFT